MNELNATIDLKELGRWIKKHRETANMSQETAASLAEMSRFQWIRIENGQKATRRDTLIRMAQAINADLAITLKKGGFVGAESEAEKSDDELVAEGVFKDYYDLPEGKRKLARRQIAAVIRTLRDEDFED